MISIIVCSRNKLLSDSLSQNIKNTIGVEHEIILIDNSDNKYSISEAYNIGIFKSKYKYLCFAHDDIKFHSSNWGKCIVTHLQPNTVGIIGLAGRKILTRIPGAWPNRIACVNIIQSDISGSKKTKVRFEPNGFKKTKKEVIMLDGVFLCMKRELFEQIKFDENIPGFHGYDFDISIQSIIAKYKNYVIYDVSVEHFSRGKMDQQYYRNLISIFKKWEKHLPLFVTNENNTSLQEIRRVERSGIFKLTNKLIKRNFSKKEIIEIIHYFLFQSEQRSNNIYYKGIKVYTIATLFLKKIQHTLKLNIYEFH